MQGFQYVMSRQAVHYTLEEMIQSLIVTIGQLQIFIQSFLAPYEDQKKNANRRIESIVSKHEDKIAEVLGETERCHESTKQKMELLMEELKQSIQDEIKQEEEMYRQNNEKILEELASIKTSVETLTQNLKQREERECENSKRFLNSFASLQQHMESMDQKDQSSRGLSLEEVSTNVCTIQSEVQSIRRTNESILQELTSTKSSEEKSIQNVSNKREEKEREEDIARVLDAVASLKQLVEENERKRVKDMDEIKSRESDPFVHVLNLEDLKATMDDLKVKVASLDMKNVTEKGKNGKEKKVPKTEPIDIKKSSPRFSVFGSLSPDKRFKFSLT